MLVESQPNDHCAGLTLTRIGEKLAARQAAKNKENVNPQNDSIKNGGKRALSILNKKTSYDDLRALQHGLPKARQAADVARSSDGSGDGHVHEHVPGERTETQHTALIRNRLQKSTGGVPRYSYFLDKPTAQGCVDAITLQHHADFAKLRTNTEFDAKFKENIGRIITPVGTREVQDYITGSAAAEGSRCRKLKDIATKPALLQNRLKRLGENGNPGGRLYLIAETASARLVHNGTHAVTAYPIIDGAKTTNLIRDTDLPEHVRRICGTSENAAPRNVITRPVQAPPAVLLTRRPFGERNMRV